MTRLLFAHVMCVIAMATCAGAVTSVAFSTSPSLLRAFRSADRMTCRSFPKWSMKTKKHEKHEKTHSSKGFGGARKAKGDLHVLSDPATDTLYKWLRKGGASVNKVAIADFNGLRGVAARQIIKAGETIVSVPMELALNLGSEGVNPGYAAMKLCKIEKSAERRAQGWYQPFFDVQPTYDQCDTTDFFNEEELLALEWPPVAEETQSRLAMLRSTYDSSRIVGVEKGDQAGITWEEFMCAAYQIVSRVLTIYTEKDGGTKYLIPMIDMFNHDPKSLHTLKCTKGQFQIIAGKTISEGEQIGIVYGGGVLNNDRFIQDYGFVQHDNEYDVKQLVMAATKEPLPGLPFRGLQLGLDDLKKLLESFSTTLDEDVAMLARGEFTSSKMRSAVTFRAEKKRAVIKAIQMLSS